MPHAGRHCRMTAVATSPIRLQRHTPPGPTRLLSATRSLHSIRPATRPAEAPVRRFAGSPTSSGRSRGPTKKTKKSALHGANPLNPLGPSQATPSVARKHRAPNFCTNPQACALFSAGTAVKIEHRFDKPSQPTRSAGFEATKLVGLAYVEALAPARRPLRACPGATLPSAAAVPHRRWSALQKKTAHRNVSYAVAWSASTP